LQRSDFEYDLPEWLIAQQPASSRDASRLLCLDRASGAVSHHVFTDFPDLVRGDELILYNNSKVMPARIWARKKTGGRVELLALRIVAEDCFESMTRSSKAIKDGAVLLLDRGNTELVVRTVLPEGRVLLEVPEGTNALDVIHGAGKMPLPPYIRRRPDEEDGADTQRYQTIFADPVGSVAAPTAGLHFTPEVVARLQEKGCELAPVTLHVGPGTFQPVRVDDIAQHRMEREWYELAEATVDAIRQAKADKRPVLAVGTTTVRCLESAAAAGQLEPGSGETEMFITPGYRFRIVDKLITNFHLPGSTLIMLVSALAGRDQVLSAYAEAVHREYRFYSYGDCMLVS
jgi:S-adenosylmethionine:tRNA ribosyltransferase-isomerase